MASIAPMHQICLENDRLQIAWALRMLDAPCGPQHLISVMVDAVFVQPLELRWAALEEKPRSSTGTSEG